LNSIENCTDKQIKIALDDLLNFKEKNELIILDADDENEFSRDNDSKSIDIKNSELVKTQEDFIFKIEVYDLSNIETELSSEPPLVNITEWYISFENELNKYLPIQLNYRIYVQQTTYTDVEKFQWKFGGGIIRNLLNYIRISRNPEIKIRSEMSTKIGLSFTDSEDEFSIPLDSATITLDHSNNEIQIKVPRKDLEIFGIAPSFGLFELPAKLTNFSVGTRYCQMNEDVYDFTKGYDSIQADLIMDYLTSFDIENLSDQEIDYSNLTSIGNFSLLYQKNWKDLDKAPNGGKSSNLLAIFPSFIDEIQISALSFLSKEYQDTGMSNSTVIIAGIKSVERLEDSTEQYKQILQTIDNIDENVDSFTFNATGGGVLNVEIDEVTGDANLIIGPSIFIIIVLVLLFSFRSPSYVLIAMLALVISSIWLFGTMALLEIPFNVIAIAIFPIVLGLGVDYSVHLFHNYRTELLKGYSPGQAIKTSIDEIGTAMFLAMVTTVIAFISFLTAQVPPIRDFGVVLALGVIYTFITSITFSAPVRYIVDRRKLKPIMKSISRFSISNIMSKTSRIIISNKKKILMVMVLVSVVMTGGALQIETGFDFNQFVPENTESRIIQDRIAENFPFSSQNQEYILIEGDIATIDCFQGIVNTHNNLEDDTYLSKEVDGSTKTRSIYTIITEAVENNQSLKTLFNIDGQTFIPKTDSDFKNLLDYLMESESYSGLTGSVLSKNGSNYDATVIRVYIDSSLETKEGTINEELKQLKRELNEDLDEYGNATAITTGGLIVTLTITDSLTVSQITSTLLSIVLAAFVVILVYKNPVLGLIAMIPVGVSIIWILGTMFYIGYTLNILTVTVTSITIGIGIDYAIHATQRFRYTADRTGDIITSVCQTISQTGGALLIAALTTTLGFGILVFAPIPPQQQFGLILSITIVFSFLTSVFLLPIILYVWGKNQKQRKGYIISSKSYDFSDKDLESCSDDE
jgi:predicted RND superfamily exporter protein